jgi:hypothetical protein
VVINMKTSPCPKLALLAITLLSLVVGAAAQIPDGDRLPYSGGLLVGRAIASGKMERPGHSALAASATRQLTVNCSPQPCTLPNIQISPTPDTNPRNETAIVTNPSNSQQLLSSANDYSCATLIGLYTSTNGGTSFTKTCMKAAPGYTGAGEPSVAYDLQSNKYIAGIQLDSLGNGAVAIQKNSGAATIVVPALFSGGSVDKPWLQVDTNGSSPHKNHLYISATQFDPSNDSEITVSTSTNGGAKFTTVPVDAEQIYPIIDQFSDLAIAKNGTIYVSWMRCTANSVQSDCGHTVATLLISSSTDGGKTWSAETTIATPTLAKDSCGEFFGCLPNTHERVSEIPVIAIDNSTGTYAGTIYAAFYTLLNTYMEEEVAHSMDGGITWSKPVRVTPTSDKHDQFFNWIHVSSKGVVGVTWLDRRNDPANIDYEAYASFSTNGGVTFSTNKNLATAASNPLDDGFNGYFMGDYTGNSWYGTKLYMAACDTRNGATCQDELYGYYNAP